MLSVPGGVQQRQRPAVTGFEQGLDGFFVFTKFGVVALVKTGPALRVVTKPFPQLGGGGQLLAPVVQGEVFLFDTPWPGAIHQHTVSVTRLDRVIDPFTVNCPWGLHCSSLVSVRCDSSYVSTQSIHGLQRCLDNVLDALRCRYNSTDLPAPLASIERHVIQVAGGIGQGGIGGEPVNRLALLFAYLV